MSQETTDNFWAAWGQPEPEAQPVFYRLYYDDNGYPLFYSMEDVPGNYIDIDQATYQDPPKHAKVVNGKLIEINIIASKKLVPSDRGVACHPSDICIVVSEDQDHNKWSLKTYEQS